MSLPVLFALRLTEEERLEGIYADCADAPIPFAMFMDVSGI